MQTFKMVLINLTFTLILISCGKDDSTSSPKECSLKPVFASKNMTAPSLQDSNYDYLTYQVSLSDDCKNVVTKHSGGFYYKVSDAVAEASAGALMGVKFDDVKKEIFSSRKALGGGSASVEREYRQIAEQMDAKAWILPWEEAPATVQVYFELPEGSEVRLYPKDVTITMKSLD